jgi:hypothetical protein
MRCEATSGLLAHVSGTLTLIRMAIKLPSSTLIREGLNCFVAWYREHRATYIAERASKGNPAKSEIASHASAAPEALGGAWHCAVSTASRAA